MNQLSEKGQWMMDMAKLNSIKNWLMSHPFRKTITLINTEPKIERNEKCPCGSGKKYKKCCINKGNKNGIEENSF